jgi:curved DNA-binding protein CbpA
MPFVDHYKVLQVDPEADADVIQAAYRTLARKYHPDVAGTREAADRMTAINAAWQILREAGRRDAYDKVRAQKLGWETPKSRPATAAGAAAAPVTPKPGWPEGRTGFRKYDPKAPRGAGPRGEAANGSPGAPPGSPSGTVLDFGRYAGWSLGEIAKHDPAFLEWFVRVPIARPYVREINELLDAIGRRAAAEAKPAPAEPARKGLFRR